MHVAAVQGWGSPQPQPFAICRFWWGKVTENLRNACTAPAPLQNPNFGDVLWRKTQNKSRMMLSQAVLVTQQLAKVTKEE